MLSIFKWQKINFQTSQFNHFAFCCKSMTSSGHDVVKVFFFTCPTDPIWVWVQRIPSFFLYYCKQKYYTHFCMAWGFMLQNQGNMPWWPARASSTFIFCLVFELKLVVYRFNKYEQLLCQIWFHSIWLVGELRWEWIHSKLEWIHSRLEGINSMLKEDWNGIILAWNKYIPIS